MDLNGCEVILAKILKELEKMLKGEIEEVKITLYEINGLDFMNFDRDINGKLIRYNNYADILGNFCKQNNIIRTEDLVNSSYIFRLGGKK